VCSESWLEGRESHLLFHVFVLCLRSCLLSYMICFMFPCVRMEMEIQIFRHINFIIIVD
jgi:hypothetical protein